MVARSQATSTAADCATSCAICGCQEGRRYIAREMMFGTRDQFPYFECGRCGCLQICEVPRDLAPYYPPEYNAFTPRPLRRGLRGWLRRKRDRAAFVRDDIMGRLLGVLEPYPVPGVSRWFERMRVTAASRILDVGCGTGELLRDLGAIGFTRLIGVDPFISHDIVYPSGAKIMRGTIHDVEGTFDVVMFHHAFEHIPDQLATLRAVARRLDPAGYCLIRVPTVSSFAWEHYREHWVQLDAPRHLFIHSTTSLGLLGERAGLVLEAVEFDSTELQFTGSELYRRNRPLTSRNGAFTRAELRRFRARARQLNEEGRGDQAAFYFRVTAPPA